MRVHRAIVVPLTLAGATTEAHADPGLGSLEALLPLYVAALAIFVLVFYAFPAWLTFRARRLHAERGLSQTKLLLHVAPAGLVGGLGVIDFLGVGLASGIAHGMTGGFGPYWVFLALSALLLVLAGSAYRHCKAGPAGD